VGAAVAVPVALATLCLWALYVRASDPPMRRFSIPVTAALVLAASFAPTPVLVIGLLLSTLLAVKLAVRFRAESDLAA
jgi:hypothetical protein